VALVVSYALALHMLLSGIAAPVHAAGGNLAAAICSGRADQPQLPPASGHDPALACAGCVMPAGRAVDADAGMISPPLLAGHHIWIPSTACTPGGPDFRPHAPRGPPLA